VTHETYDMIIKACLVDKRVDIISTY